MRSYGPTASHHNSWIKLDNDIRNNKRIKCLWKKAFGDNSDRIQACSTCLTIVLWNHWISMKSNKNRENRTGLIVPHYMSISYRLSAIWNRSWLFRIRTRIWVLSMLVQENVWLKICRRTLVWLAPLRIQASLLWCMVITTSELWRSTKK